MLSSSMRENVCARTQHAVRCDLEPGGFAPMGAQRQITMPAPSHPRGQEALDWIVGLDSADGDAASLFLLSLVIVIYYEYILAIFSSRRRSTE